MGSNPTPSARNRLKYLFLLYILIPSSLYAQSGVQTVGITSFGKIALVIMGIALLIILIVSIVVVKMVAKAHHFVERDGIE